jgi:hypothetical protein
MSIELETGTREIILQFVQEIEQSKTSDESFEIVSDDSNHLSLSNPIYLQTGEII